MVALPLPLIASLLLGFWLARALIEGNRGPLLLAAVAMAAAQGGLIALVQYYGVTTLRLAQPVGAMVVPPLVWLAFEAQTAGRRNGLSWLPHLLGPAAVVAALAVAPALLDVLTPLSFAAYGGALLWAMRSGGRPLPNASLEHGDLPRFFWRVIAASLLLSALSDGLIAADYALNEGARHGVLLSVFSALSLLTLGLCGLSDVLAEPERSTVEPAATGGEVSPPQPEDQQIFDGVDAAMRSEKLYLDPDLTLAKIARRLKIPAKSISAAINRIEEQNVSRYVNAFRVEHAREMIEDGASVTKAMLESGFNTKSNFNREFRRVTGQTPSDIKRCSDAGLTA